jgi:hypothetical protein
MSYYNGPPMTWWDFVWWTALLSLPLWPFVIAITLKIYGIIQ